MTASETYTNCYRTWQKPKHCQAGNWDDCLIKRIAGICPKIPQIELPKIKLNYGYCTECNAKLPPDHQDWVVCDQCAENDMEQAAYAYNEPF